MRGFRELLQFLGQREERSTGHGGCWPMGRLAVWTERDARGLVMGDREFDGLIRVTCVAAARSKGGSWCIGTPIPVLRGKRRSR